MENWIASNIGTIITLLSLIGGFLVSFGKLRAKIDAKFGEVDEKLGTLSSEFEKLRDGGLPVLCRLHEERLTRLESELKEHAQSVSTSVGELKQMMREFFIQKEKS